MHPCTCLSRRNRAYLTTKPGGEASLEAPVGWDWSGLVFHPNRACAVLRYTRRGLILSSEFDPTQWQLSKDGLTYRRSTPVSRTAQGPCRLVQQRRPGLRDAVVPELLPEMSQRILTHRAARRCCYGWGKTASMRGGSVAQKTL